MKADAIAAAGLGTLVRRIANCSVRLERNEHPRALREINQELGLLEDELNKRFPGKPTDAYGRTDGGILGHIDHTDG